MKDLENIEVVRNYNVIAVEINTIKAQTNKVLLISAIEIGRRLKEAKEIVGHGNWEKWLEIEVSYSNRTASNLMRIHEEYGPGMLDDSNRVLTSDLGYTQAVVMLKLDAESRDNFLVVHDVDEMSIKELDTEIKKVNEIKETKEDLLKQIETLKGTNETLKGDNEALSGNNETLKGSNETLEKELTVKVKDIETKEKEIKGFVKDIKDLDEKVKETPTSDDSAEKLLDFKLEISLKKQRIKELENELRSKPKEIETQQIKYETPEAVLKELVDLKTKLNSSENAMKFKSTFSTLMNQFNDLIGIVDNIKSDEPDKYDKYKGAVNKLLEKLTISD